MFEIADKLASSNLTQFQFFLLVPSELAGLCASARAFRGGIHSRHYSAVVNSLHVHLAHQYSYQRKMPGTLPLE